MTGRDPQIDAAVSELANALQAAAPAATRLRLQLGDQVDEARTLERAVRAVRQLQPASGGAR